MAEGDRARQRGGRAEAPGLAQGPLHRAIAAHREPRHERVLALGRHPEEPRHQGRQLLRQEGPERQPVHLVRVEAAGAPAASRRPARAGRRTARSRCDASRSCRRRSGRAAGRGPARRSPTDPGMPIWPDVSWGRITVIEVDRPSVSANTSHRSRAMTQRLRPAPCLDCRDAVAPCARRPGRRVTGRILRRTVGPLLIGDASFDVDSRPLLMGTVNLSRDSTYRESIAVSADSAVRKGRVMAAEGADIVDIGAESSTAQAARVAPQAQIAALRAGRRALVADGLLVSVETYEPTVVEAALRAGATVLNMTGSRASGPHARALAAEHEATVILCYAGRRERAGGHRCHARRRSDPRPPRSLRATGRARPRAWRRIGWSSTREWASSTGTSPIRMVRARHQAQVLLNGFRLRSLGCPDLQCPAARLRPVRGAVPDGGGLLRRAGTARWHERPAHARGRPGARRDAGDDECGHRAVRRASALTDVLCRSRVSRAVRPARTPGTATPRRTRGVRPAPPVA